VDLILVSGAERWTGGVPDSRSLLGKHESTDQIEQLIRRFFLRLPFAAGRFEAGSPRAAPFDARRADFPARMVEVERVFGGLFQLEGRRTHASDFDLRRMSGHSSRSKRRGGGRSLSRRRSKHFTMSRLRPPCD
jgi:hypothetical protein